MTFTFSLDGNIQAGDTASVEIQVADVTTSLADYPSAVDAIQDAVDNYAGPGTLVGSFAGGAAPYILTFTGGVGAGGGTVMTDLEVTLSPINDTLFESSEMLNVTLANAGGSISSVAINDTDGTADGVQTVPLTITCLLYTSPSPRDLSTSRMPSSA